MKLEMSIRSDIEPLLRENLYFVGKLADKNDLAGTTLLPVSFQDEYNQYIQFQIKCLSDIPRELSDSFRYSNKVFTGSTRARTNQRIFQSILDDRTLADTEKRDKIRKKLEGKIVLFRMANTPRYIYIDIVAMEEVNGFEEEYILVPSPQLKVGESRKDFEERLNSKLRPFSLPYYPNICEEPEFIYLEGRLYSNISLSSNYSNPTTYSQNNEEEVEYSDEDDFLKNVALSYKNMLYVISYKQAFNFRSRKKKLLHSRLEYEKKEQEIELPINSEYDNNDKENIETERLFLEKLRENALKQGLVYAPEDIYNFHTCVKTNLLTVIGGMSGIGKSKLAVLYAETLGLRYGKEALVLPISPAYAEPNDILGYLNPNTGIYSESETGLVKLLMDAEADANSKFDSKLYMVIFDEMNLAQVEHWFSPFISLLEMKEESRYLTLFNENSHCVNKYPSKIKIGDNIIFIGTVNFDETTKLFSDRLLDRANVFIPKKNSLKSLYNSYYDLQDDEDDRVEPIHCTRDIYKKWIFNGGSRASSLRLNEEEITILDELHKLLNEQDRQKGVSFRTATSIAKFLNNVPLKEDGTPYLNRKHAFDLQIKQRISTKIRGIDSFVRPLVGTFNGDDYQPGTITEFLLSEEIQNYYNFAESVSDIKYKAKELMYYGFAN